MSALENPSHQETPPTSEINKISEFVNLTEISNFEGSGLLTNEQVANYIRETLPPSHFEGCPSIEYAPTHPYFWDEDGLATLAFIFRDNHEIYVGPSERFVGTFEGKEGMLGTITHEIGHNVHYNLMEYRPDIAEKWEQVSASSGYVTDYAENNVLEDFAESYRTYVCDPELLQFKSPEKYDFLRDVIFAGREYPVR